MILPCSRRAYRAWWLAAMLGIMAVPTVLSGQTVAEVQVTPETMTLGVAQKQAIFAAAYDRQGNLIPDAKFVFWSSDTSIVQVSPEGVAIGGRPGLAKVEARTGTRRASLAVLVTGGAATDNRPPQGTVLTLDPPAPVVLPGEAVQLTPQAVREDGSPFAIGSVSWKSLQSGIAAVDSTGLVLGLAPGRSIVQAITAGGLMATAPIEVAPADFTVLPASAILAIGTSDTLRARVPKQNNRRLRSGIQWQTADSSIVTVDPAGIVYARKSGTTTLTASGFGQERRIAVTVHKTPETLIIMPRHTGRLQVPRHGTLQVSVTVEAADSTPIPQVVPTWSLRDTAIISFDTATKIVTAKAIGTATLTATVPGFQPVVWTIDVIPGLVRLQHHRLAVAPGEHMAMDARLSDAKGAAVGQMSDLRWSSDRPDIASVSTDGAIAGVTPGRAAIVATTPWGHSDTVLVFVTGDLLVTSNRSGTFSLYTVLREKPDAFFSLFRDSNAILDGTYSPNRTRIAYSTNRTGNYDIYIADADGRNTRPVVRGTSDKRNPTWASDRHLLYVEYGSDSIPQIYLVDIDSGAPRALTKQSGSSTSPAAAPTSAHLALIGVREGKPDLYLVHPDSGIERRLTNDDDRELLPQFFPNGDVLYAQERNRGRSARLIRRPLTGERGGDKLFDTDQPLTALSVSRDGRWIAYAIGKVTDPAKGRAKFQLFVRDVTGDTKPIAVPLRPDEQIVHLAF